MPLRNLIIRPQKLYGGAECDSGGLGSLQVPYFCSRSSGEIQVTGLLRKSICQTSNLEIPQTLGTLEKNTFIQIIMGKRPISYFDEFVSKWYEQGGDQLVKAIREDSR